MHTALLIIDMFNHFKFINGNQLEAATHHILDPIVSLKKFAQEKNFPVIYINDNLFDDEISVRIFIEKTYTKSNQKIIETLKPDSNNIFLYKKKFSAFFETKLHEILKERKIQQLIITGIAGHICVLFTVNDAYMRGYKIITPIDAYACSGTLQKIFVDEMFKHVFHSDLTPTQELIKKIKTNE